MHHRKILFEYSPELLDQMISIVTTATVIAYILYTVSEDTVRKFGTDRAESGKRICYGVQR